MQTVDTAPAVLVHTGWWLGRPRPHGCRNILGDGHVRGKEPLSFLLMRSKHESWGSHCASRYELPVGQRKTEDHRKPEELGFLSALCDRRIMAKLKVLTLKHAVH